jgi:pyrroline-5-carboxylate reductase
MTSNQAVADSNDVIVLATRPAHCVEVLKEPVFKSSQLLISVVAGTRVGSLRQAVSLEVAIV